MAAAVLLGLLALATAQAPAIPAPRWTLGTRTELSGQFAAGHEPSAGLSLGLDARLEVSRLLLEASAGVRVESTELPWSRASTVTPTALFAHASAAVLLGTDERVAPYLGGGVEPRWLLVTGTPGLTLTAEAGVMLWRRGRTRLTVDLRLGQALLAVPDLANLQRTRAYPTEVGLGVSLGW